MASIIPQLSLIRYGWMQGMVASTRIWLPATSTLGFRDSQMVPGVVTWEVDQNMPEGSSLIRFQIDGEPAYVCCGVADFFYQDGSWEARSKTGQRVQLE
jgi:hypothetical protein